MPIDKSIDSTDKFAFKNYIKIINAVVASYKGRPIGLQEACNQLNQYIMEHKLQPITVGYNVTKKTEYVESGKHRDRCICGNQPKHLISYVIK